VLFSCIEDLDVPLVGLDLLVMSLRKARMGSGLRRGERPGHDLADVAKRSEVCPGASAGLLGQSPDYQNVFRADDPVSLTFLLS